MRSGRWDLYRCESCCSAYLDPRPTHETIHLAYQQYYTHQRSTRQDTESLAAWRRLVRALANGYRNHRYGGQLQPQSTLGRWLIPLFPALRVGFDREMRYLQRLSPGAKLLDVGFGCGAFLDLAQQVGWHVYGVDSDPVSVANAKNAGLNVRLGRIEAFADMAGQFDVITLSHVIEHVHDPVGVLEHAYALLKPGGWLYVDTPNIDAVGHANFKEHWRGLEVPRHLLIFNGVALERVLQGIGFDDCQRIVSFSPYAALASASHAIQRGVDPYSLRRVEFGYKVRQFFLSVNPFVSRNSTEFITLRVRRPSL